MELLFIVIFSAIVACCFACAWGLFVGAGWGWSLANILTEIAMVLLLIGVILGGLFSLMLGIAHGPPPSFASSFMSFVESSLGLALVAMVRRYMRRSATAAYFGKLRPLTFP